MSSRISPSVSSQFSGHARQDWQTPKPLFDLLNSFYHFTLDAAASEFNTLCPEFYSPQDDALTKPWNGKVFCHPPYSNKLGSWVNYAYKYIKPGSAAHE
jgi:phage N-6-adenine-methyltransferase